MKGVLIAGWMLLITFVVLCVLSIEGVVVANKVIAAVVFFLAIILIGLFTGYYAP